MAPQTTRLSSTTSLVPIVVISQVVKAVFRIKHNFLGSDPLDLGSDLSRRAGSVLLQANKIGCETRDVRAGHAGPRYGFGGIFAADPGGENVNTRGKDVKSYAPVRELGASVIPVCCTNGDGVHSRRRGDAGGIGIFVSGGGDDDNALSDDGPGGLVEGFRVIRTQGHVDDCLRSLILLSGVLCGPLHTCEDVGTLAVSIRIKDSDGDNLGLASNTKAGSSGDTGNMSAMSILISIG